LLHRYHGASLVSDEELRLTTTDPNLLFEGFAEHPVIAARALATVATVAATRFYEPPAMVAARVRAADPVVTSEAERLRFESFSQCCGVHCRFDMLEDGLDIRVSRPGTTNVDFGPAMVSALDRITRRTPLRLTVGVDTVTVESLGAAIIERKVPLPDRWVRGFAEVQVALTEAQPILRLEAIEAQRFLHRLPTGRDGSQTYWTAASGTSVRLTPRRTTGGICLAAPKRLRVLEPLRPFVQSLTVFSDPQATEPVPAAWVAELPGGRLTLTLSADWQRGFSGEGGLLLDLATPASATDADLLRQALSGRARFSLDDAADATGTPRERCRSAMTWLGAHGEIGHDLSDDAYYWRHLPYRTQALEQEPPRLRDAKRLLRDKGGSVEKRADGTFSVLSQNHEYRASIDRDTFKCTCPWFAKHGASRGPCKHVLACVLAETPTPATDQNGESEESIRTIRSSGMP
jgi:hypothetical protein